MYSLYNQKKNHNAIFNVKKKSENKNPIMFPSLIVILGQCHYAEPNFYFYLFNLTAKPVVYMVITVGSPHSIYSSHFLHLPFWDLPQISF